MALLGIGHHGGEHGTHGHSSHGHDASTHVGGHHAAAAHHGAASHHNEAATHAAHSHHAAHHNTHHSHHDVGRELLSWLSPRTLFSVLVGFGASGTLLKLAFAAAIWIPLGAIVGGIVFEKFLIRPLWNLLLRFASNPARTLASSVASEAIAATNFDAQGNGLVQIELDGQLRQVLGTLREEEKSQRVTAGETLLVIAVDEARNCCTVSRLDR